MEKKIISRRDFIKTASLAAGASVLAACTTVETVEVVRTVEVPVEKEVIKTVEIVKEGETIIVTATPEPTVPPEPAVLDVWFNTDIPDITVEWAPDPENEEFKKQWYFGGLGRAIFNPWLEKHPGVSMKITTHSWDWDLRQNQLMALAAGIYPDTTYGEAYVNEFVQLGVFSPLSNEVAQKFPEGTYAGATVDGVVYGIPKSSGADVLFINLTLWEKAGLDRTKLPATWEELVAACQAISIG